MAIVLTLSGQDTDPVELTITSEAAPIALELTETDFDSSRYYTAGEVDAKIQGVTAGEISSLIHTQLAGAILSSGRAVMLNSSEKVVYFDPSVLSNYGKLLGITKTAVAADAYVTCVTDGFFSMAGAAWTVGATYYAGPNGSLTTVVPNSGLLQSIGVAVTTEKMQLNFDTLIEL